MRDIANGRTVPASTCGIAVVKSANIIDTRPAIMSSSAGPVVLYGTCNMLISPHFASVWPPTMPAVLPLANDSSPGWTLAYSTSSLTEPMGSFALTTSISVKLPTRVIGTKSLIGSIVQVLVYERVGRQRRVGCHQER